MWERIGDIDVALLPIDGSKHVMSYEQVERVAERLGARMIVPHHYYVWDIVTRGSTLLPPDEWVNGRPGSRWVGAGQVSLTRDEVKAVAGQALCFGECVAFEKPGRDPGRMDADRTGA